jgi:hypothetical protein
MSIERAEKVVDPDKGNFIICEDCPDDSLNIQQVIPAACCVTR